ncbi:Protein of unknown function [Nitrosospira sp. Nsp18]|uniref:OBAP family protein n=1 Tax=Nitrosospira sp. Nsp18 TaxID=1855334 RepID=UPI000880D386|nr:OBAP family protein [Nitrosospira sp. Nsp18]SDA15513.1 Protein of unknown function [Nitrosospira sp. Nsp18]
MDGLRLNFRIILCVALLPAAIPTASAAGSLTQMAQASSLPDTIPAGEEKMAKTRALELGAKLLQGKSPLKPFDIYLVGFHPMKDSPEDQMEAHHYCHQVNEDFAQCVLFDDNTEEANLNGIEYIISEKLFAALPEAERKYWHPHNGEILTGQLVAPGIPKAAEKELMKGKMNSYGKTWHVWNTGYEGNPGDKMPLGVPMLGWSFNRDGEAIPGLVEKRDKKLKLNSSEERRRRADLEQFARPQSGVDDLKGKLARPTKDIRGVMDRKSAGKVD